MQVTKTFAFAVAMTAVGVLAAQAPRPEPQAPKIAFPPDHVAAQWAPAVLLWAPEGESSGGDVADALLARGFVVATVDGTPDPTGLERLAQTLRHRVRVAGGSMHAVVGRSTESALAAIVATRHQFGSVTCFASARDADLAAVRAFPHRSVAALATTDAGEVAAHVADVIAERLVPGVAGEVSRVLDSFHDAATVADEDRYFAILPEDAVFLGTDGSERWTGKQFRGFAMRYFERESAWTYVPHQRHVRVAEGGAFAWFDEVLENRSYGVCRGTGVLAKRGARWVLLQYNLTVPVPNAIMGEVVRLVREHGRAGK